MAEPADLIDFEAIETQKENIQSLPGGRSAKQLALLMSPISSTISETQTLRATARAEFEAEIATIEEADDPLDIYDRYVKWCVSAYPSGSKESGLVILLERATKTFLGNTLYKNDPRYLKLWLLYIHLFADSPRETYAFLNTHGVGEQLALFYEEYAAWLEAQGRWSQAEEVFSTGVDRNARPTERLIRKYAEFQHRKDTKTASDGPASPALPKVRPALATKANPFTSADTDADPQARDREASAMSAAAKPKSGKKMAIFADSDDAPPKSNSPQAWDSIGSVAERKKENKHEAKPWAGEKLDGGKKLVGGGKMMVFRDTVS
jgi:checkpoint serine/threonine-protein kinase